jgi:hypothetical protein
MTAVRLMASLGATLAALLFVAVADAAPIEGNWESDNGALYQFYSTGPRHFGLRVLRASSNPCSHVGNTTTRLSGSGLEYSGTIPYYRDSDCEYTGDGSLRIDIEPDGERATWHSEPAPGQSCCVVDRTLERVNTRLPRIVRESAALLRRRYRALVRAHRATAIAHRFRRIRNAARHAERRVSDFNAISDEDVELRGCAVGALSRVEGAATRHRAGRVRSGIRRLRGCLP